jgi:hypothetical protein
MTTGTLAPSLSMLWNLPKSCKLIHFGESTFANMNLRVMFVNLQVVVFYQDERLTEI